MMHKNADDTLLEVKELWKVFGNNLPDFDTNDTESIKN